MKDEYDWMTGWGEGVSDERPDLIGYGEGITSEENWGV